MPLASQSTPEIRIITSDVRLAVELELDTHLFGEASTLVCWPDADSAQDLLSGAQRTIIDTRRAGEGDLACWLSALPIDCKLLVITTLDFIDRDFAVFDARSVQFIIGMKRAERFFALVEFLDSPASGASESNLQVESRRLHGIAQEIAVIARRLAEAGGDEADDAPDGFADQRSGLADRALGFTPEASNDRRTAGGRRTIRLDSRAIRRTISVRRLRDRFFDGSLFADPAWDILLDLFAARQEGASVSVSSLCIAAAVPPTTALRWIGLMSDQGLLVRQADPKDARRIFIALSDVADQQMRRYLDAVAMQPGVLL